MIKHRKRGLPRIQLDEKHLPYRWHETLVQNQKIGGVFLVFLSGDNNKEINNKLEKIKDFCKTLEVKIKPFAKVTTRGE